MTADAAERLARLIADAAATRLGSAAIADLVTATPFASARWGEREFPVVTVTASCGGAAVGETVVVLAPAGARALVTALDPDSPELAEDLGEDDLSTIASAVDELLAGTAAALELELTLAPARATLLQDAGTLPAVDLEGWVISYALQGEGLSLEVVQTIPASLSSLLAVEPEAPITAEPEPAAPDDASKLAVERAAALAADATVDVLSALFSDELSAATPTVAAAAGDIADSLEYPLIVAEVSYLSGLAGANRFVLRPAAAAQLAAAMMGTPETIGDGLSAIELSAVSEAMNQVMSATAHELSKALGITIEVSPPTCIVVDNADQARENVGAPAYRASFQIISTVFGAEIVQLVSPELALSLAGAFASFALGGDMGESLDDAFDAFSGLPLSGFAGVAPAPPDPHCGARELLSGIRVRVSAELGRSRMPIARVANLPAGSIVVLDRAPADPVDVLVNGTPFAQAKVVLVDGEYAVQILSLVPLDLNA